MKAVIQRVSEASVEIEGKLISSIEKGFLVLFCAEKEDTYEKADKLAGKIAALRCFSDENGKMNLSVKDIDGQILAVSQFTLCASLKKGNRPGFDNAMDPGNANQIYEYFVSKLKSYDIPVRTGIFGADMQVRLLNDGPVTFVYDNFVL